VKEKGGEERREWRGREGMEGMAPTAIPGSAPGERTGGEDCAVVKIP